MTVDPDISALGQLHMLHAKGRALELVGFSDAVFPFEWKGAVSERVTMTLCDFALHARRINAIYNLDDFLFPEIDKTSTKIAQGDPGAWETRYQFALNRLAHAQSYTFGYVHADHRKLYVGSDANVIPMYVRVMTDRFEEATISIYGIAFCYLNEVLKEVSRRAGITV